MTDAGTKQTRRFGIIGLGRMGANLARQAMEKGHEVVGYSLDHAATRDLGQEGLVPATSIPQLVAALPQPRIVLLYVPHGAPTEVVCDELRRLLDPDDVVVDGGNSQWEDSTRRHHLFDEAGIRFLDAGTSGGVGGARFGACFMVGGDRDAFETVAPILRHLAVDDQGVHFAGPSGAGHFAKLVHNGIEFGMVQAIAEGVELLLRSGYDLDLPALFDNWNHGSVIRSWLVDLMSNALREHDDLGKLSTYVEDTGEVKWLTRWATDHDIPIPVITTSQTALIQYRDVDWPQAKAHALLRNQYGGHPIHDADDTRSRT